MTQGATSPQPPSQSVLTHHCSVKKNPSAGSSHHPLGSGKSAAIVSLTTCREMKRWKDRVLHPGNQCVLRVMPCHSTSSFFLFHILFCSNCGGGVTAFIWPRLQMNRPLNFNSKGCSILFKTQPITSIYHQSGTRPCLSNVLTDRESIILFFFSWFPSLERSISPQLPCCLLAFSVNVHTHAYAHQKSLKHSHVHALHVCVLHKAC